MTSSVTLLEVLVIPFRFANAALIVERDFLRAVAQVRAATRAKAPDAMQLAAAMAAGCPVFLTNDDRIPNVPGLRKLLLEDYLPHA